MEESSWRSPNEGRMRARVEARRKRTQQISTLRVELEENSRPVLGALEQVKEQARTIPLPVRRTPAGSRFTFPGRIRYRMHSQMPGCNPYRFPPRLFTALAAGLVLLLCGVFFAARGRNTNHLNVIAAPLPTDAPNATMAEVKLLSQVNQPQKPVTIMVLGSDKRPEDNSFRTDVFMLLTVDASKGEVSALSFPRDLIAKIPGYGEDRVNVIMQYGGFKLVQDTLEQNFGVRPDYYFMTNFDGFVGMINGIGGIDVQIGQPFEDACDLYWSRAGVCTVKPGKLSMDGAAALWYIRSRHTSSDFDRLRRAQEVMAAVFDKFMNKHAILRLPEMYQKYAGDVQTNMNVQQILSLAPTAALVIRDTRRIHRYAIPPEDATNYWTATGAEVLLPNYEAIREIVKQATFAP